MKAKIWCMVGIPIIDEALAAYYDIRNLRSIFNVKFSWASAASILVCDGILMCAFQCDKITRMWKLIMDPESSIGRNIYEVDGGLEWWVDVIQVKLNNHEAYGVASYS
jgi:hypothetical protein